jgi:alpha-ribazole phosphatase
MTEGNKFGRYIGITDQPLCPEGRELLASMQYPRPEALYVSPLIRCRETAELLFPEMEYQIISKLAECNFGDFENKNYKELDGNPDYQAWVDSNATLPFPGGESTEEFKERSLKGFCEVVSDCVASGVSYGAIVAHGGTIMTIMEQFARPQKLFYEWHVKNGCGYEVAIDEALWRKVTEKQNFLEYKNNFVLSIEKVRNI